MNKIKGAVLDLDNFLICTNELFEPSFQEIARLISTEVNLPVESTYKALIAINESVHRRYHTDRNFVWPVLLEELSAKFSLGKGSLKEIERYANMIYTTIPEVKDGAFDMLRNLKSEGCLIGINTQADEPWTRFKLEKTGLIRFVNSIHCVEEGPKDATSWIIAAAKLRLSPTECAMGGDSKTSDILPATEAGYSVRVWFNDSYWSRSHAGELPEGTVEINTLSEFPARVVEYNEEYRIKQV